MTLSSSNDLVEGVDYVVTDSGCWEWLKFRDQHGYGRCSAGKYGEGRACRASYIIAKGPIPEGLYIDHLCRNPPCINPDHLEPVTPAENVRRGLAAKLTFESAKEIRRRVAAGEPYAPIAEQYGVSEYVMWQIAEDITWREDPDAPRTPVRPERFCLECGVQITEGNRHKKFCSPSHRTTWNARRLRRERAAA